MHSVILNKYSHTFYFILHSSDKSLTFMQYRKKYGTDGKKPSFISFLSITIYIFSTKDDMINYRLPNNLSIFSKLK